MSQPSEDYPAFQYTTYFDPHASQESNSYQQWAQHGPGSVRNVASASGPVSTAMTAAMYGHPSLPPTIQRTSHRVENNLRGPSHLVVPNQQSRSRPSMSSPSHMDPIPSPNFGYNFDFTASSTGSMASSSDPRTSVDHGMNIMSGRKESTANEDPLMMRVYGGHHDEPWSAMRLTGHEQSNSDAASSFPGPNMSYRQYRKPAGSDSGYYTQPPAPQSVISNEPDRVDQDLPSDMFRMPNLTVSSAPSETTEYVADHASQYSGRSTSHNKSTYKCPRCNETSKCPSDFKKHMLKHDKPHTCDVSGCRRAAQGKGFTTINDLQRHKKSVHRIGVERDSYQCASEHCRNKGKIWPRLDNFKQHISRMHKDEDEQELIRKSAYRGHIPPSAMAQADILAGIGIEGQAAGNELDDPASGISLTPDQDENPWASFDSGSQKYTLGPDRMNPDESNRFLNAPDPRFAYNNGRRSATPLSPPGLDSTNRQDSLKMLADVASVRESPSVPVQRQLSSAPQTKAEQQKMITHAEQQRVALQKFGKALVAEYQADPSADGTDLENVVLRVLSGTTQQRRNESSVAGSSSLSSDELGLGRALDTVMTKAEAMKASQAISNLIKQSRSSPFTSRARRSSRVSSSDKFQCANCDVTLARACDMKKHMKRHTKPYGCTYPKCHKRFGAKSDWKRHENSQHFQMEAFRCQCPSSTLGTPCGELFYRMEPFRQHVKNEHKVDDEDVAEEAKTCRIGKNYQGQFWCGFCETIIKLKEKRNAAWDERFDHIDAHFNKERRGIEEWLCVEARKTKGEILKVMDRTKFDDEDGDDDGEGEPDDGPPAPYDAGEVMHDVCPRPPDIPPSIPLVDDLSRKRQLPEEFAPPPVPKRSRADVDRYCCSCGEGPWLRSVYGACLNCHHHFCGNCPVHGIVVGLDGGIMLE
ncbi:hypothetical protein BU23DRAFT_78906 [Bimuria novae-zelandiae CBS 107.79]|uniref:C2H2-type domain-containing protein n=1 Tax=Bimuria novae-zelandiae CBS 107.79 TaxID=1447943 RepID=A0A6A5VJH0_9PLEO|nr:hypothetical protein BU23DRAFT_78906 [Bimuria novae-zelandiae CBS 107.79]